MTDLKQKDSDLEMYFSRVISGRVVELFLIFRNEVSFLPYSLCLPDPRGDRDRNSVCLVGRLAHFKGVPVTSVLRLLCR